MIYGSDLPTRGALKDASEPLSLKPLTPTAKIFVTFAFSSGDICLINHIRTL